MEFIAHRINRVSELRRLPPAYGAELDLRDDLNGNVYIQHNPFEPGESFADYLREYRHGTLILNIKSERIEPRVLELIRQYHVERYFFLDSSFPMIYLLSSQGERNVALRFSELEGMDTVRSMAGRVRWVWIDCFTRLPIDADSYRELKALGYRLCLVSPELQGRDAEIESYAAQMRAAGIRMDAICTKAHNIPRWRKAMDASQEEE